jgi:hypothetical protein
MDTRIFPRRSKMVTSRETGTKKTATKTVRAVPTKPKTTKVKAPVLKNLDTADELTRIFSKYDWTLSKSDKARLVEAAQADGAKGLRDLGCDHLVKPASHLL